MSYTTISADQLKPLLAENAQVIDVRSPGEYASLHVKGATLMPLDKLELAEIKDGPVYILCQSGKRACMAADKLIAGGRQDVYVIEGGTEAAVATGVEVVRGKGTISIERQVRIAAGGMVFIGTMLGLFVHTGFFGLPAFVGAGLVFAGVTDTCGMGMMLGKCPWNQ